MEFSKRQRKPAKDFVHLSLIEKKIDGNWIVKGPVSWFEEGMDFCSFRICSGMKGEWADLFFANSKKIQMDYSFDLYR